MNVTGGEFMNCDQILQELSMHGGGIISTRAAEAAGYGHMYLEAPGDHEWPYWDKAIQYAFQFFRNMDMKTTPIY